jgi:hypothetical protein
MVVKRIISTMEAIVICQSRRMLEIIRPDVNVATTSTMVLKTVPIAYKHDGHR